MNGRRIAFLIGNDHFPYADTIADLNFPVNDVNAMSELLDSDIYGRFDETNVLINEDSQSVLETLESGLRKLSSDDFVVIYYAGHGVQTRSGKLCLATRNTARDKIRSTSLPVESIRDFVSDTYARQRVLILDCCYSGGAEDAWLRSDLETSIQVATQDAGIYLLTASTKIAPAMEKAGHGVLTKHLIEGIKTGDADTNNKGWVSMDDLYSHVTLKVPGEANQMPMRSAFGAKGKLCFAFTKQKPNEGKNIQEKELLTQLQINLTKYLDAATDLCTVWSQDTVSIVHYPEAIERIDATNKNYYNVTNDLWGLLPTLENNIEDIWGNKKSQRYVRLYKKIRFCHSEKAIAINQYQQLLLPIPEKTPGDDPMVIEAEAVRINIIKELKTCLVDLNHEVELFLEGLRNNAVELQY